jgi:hypothetical protein
MTEEERGEGKLSGEVVRNTAFKGGGDRKMFVIESFQAVLFRPSGRFELKGR